MLRTNSRQRLIALALGWGALALTATAEIPTASAEVDSASRSAARKLGYKGVKAYQAEDYEQATDKLERAYSVVQAPSLALWSARALAKTGKLVEASERYLEATRLSVDAGGDPKVQEKAKADAKKERAELEERIPIVIVLIDGADAGDVDVTIDGVKVSAALFGAGRPTNPGHIEVEAKLGGRLVKGTVELAEGEEKSITLSFKSGAAAAVPPEEEELADDAGEGDEETSGVAATPEDSGSGRGWQPIAGWVGIGLGGAGLIFGGVTGGLAIGKNNELEADCPGGVCPPGMDSQVSEYDSLRTMSTVGFIAGGVLAATGVTLLLTAPKKKNTAYVSPYVAATSIGLKGKF